LSREREWLCATTSAAGSDRLERGLWSDTAAKFTAAGVQYLEQRVRQIQNQCQTSRSGGYRDAGLARSESSSLFRCSNLIRNICGRETCSEGGFERENWSGDSRWCSAAEASGGKPGAAEGGDGEPYSATDNSSEPAELMLGLEDFESLVPSG